MNTKMDFFKSIGFNYLWSMGIIDKHIESISKLCSIYHVEKMYLFGSASGPDISDKSDVDFLVRFKSFDLSDYFENYMKFKENLKNLLGREIDLVEEQTLKNPVLINSINRTKALIYG